ncbi:hypothetical protein HYY70_06850, partial [Candidatus Woesearchaeota archaeon]|nr:hypothetical protein [Candidatus Woesearchaeota archaeon]
IAESEIPLGFNGGVSPVPILDLSDEALAKLNGEQLVDLVAQHIWKIRPRALLIRGHSIREDARYHQFEVAGATYKTPFYLDILVKKGKLHVIKEEVKGKTRPIKTYIGYEVIRLHLKPNSSVGGSLDDLSKEFYISEAVARKLAKEKEIKTRDDPAKGTVLLPGQLTEFFDRVLPMYESLMYRTIRGLPENPALNHIPYNKPPNHT